MNQARRVTAATVVIVLAAIYIGTVFQIGNGVFWTAGLGDWLDPYFINSLMEWWYQSLRRFENPATPPVFHPVEGTLGYSHGLILFVPFYVPFRMVLHPFQAYNLSIFLVILTGTLCLYLWLRRWLRLSMFEALVLTTFFAASPNVLNHGVNIWTQRASVYLVPPILLVVSAAVSAGGRGRAALAFVAGLLAVLLFTQDFYSAQFTFFFAGIYFLPRLLTRASGPVRDAFTATRGRPVARAVLVIGMLAAGWAAFVAFAGGVSVHVLGLRIRSTDPVRPALLAVVLLAVFLWMRRGIARTTLSRPPAGATAAGLGAVLGAAVFLWIYLPVYLAYPGFAEEEYLRVLHQRPLGSLRHPATFVALHEGFATLRSFLLLPLALAVGWLAPRRDRAISGVAVSVWMLAALLVFLVPFRFGDTSVWGALLRPLPGFNAIRDPLRIIYQFELAAVLAVALVVSRLAPGTMKRAIIPLVAIVLILLSPNRTVFEFNRPNSDFNRWVAAPIRVDPSCRSFYMRAGPPDYVGRSPEPWTLYSNDAAFIAMRLGVPTLHGVSAWTPQNWHVRQPLAPDFVWGVHDWTTRHQLDGVCGMDLEHRTMTLGLPAESSAVR